MPTMSMVYNAGYGATWHQMTGHAVAIYDIEAKPSLNLV